MSVWALSRLLTQNDFMELRSRFIDQETSELVVTEWK